MLREKSFRTYLLENIIDIKEPHIVTPDKEISLPKTLEKLVEAFRNSRDIIIGKEISNKGGTKNITLKTKKIYLTGDAVLSFLTKKTPSEFSLVTDAHPEEVIKIVEGADFPIKVIFINKKTGTVKVQIKNDEFVIETMKKEDGDFTSDVYEDCQRRRTKATCLGLYYDLIGNKILDYMGGLRHLQNKEIKYLDNSVFEKDPYEKFSYAVLHAKTGILPNPDELLKKSTEPLDNSKIQKVFWQGFQKNNLLDFSSYIKIFSRLGILDEVFPNLTLEMKIPSNMKFKIFILAYLLHKNPPTDLVSKLKKLSYPEQEIRDVVFLINLLYYKDDYENIFAKEVLRTNLTKTQIEEWAKIFGLQDKVKNLINNS